MYTPVVNGFGQSIYTDAMGTAFAGQLANASDKNLVDAAMVGSDVPFAKCGNVYGLNTAVNGVRVGVNTYQVCAYTSDDKTDACIIVRNQQTQTNDKGECGWYAGTMANVLRLNRVGGRIWANVYASAQITPGPLYVVTASTNSDIDVGTLTNLSTVTDATAVAIDGLSVVGTYTPASDGYALCQLEINFTLKSNE